MSEAELRIGIAELALVRITCKSCGVVTELPISGTGKAFDRDGKCKHCKSALAIPNSPESAYLTDDGSRTLAEILDALANSKTIGIEFVVSRPPIDWFVTPPTAAP